MKTLILFAGGGLLLLLGGCGSVELAGSGRAAFIGLSPDSSRLVVKRTGAAFSPWGFNYDRDHRMRLLEEYWEAEWATVESDFREMKALGANTVRVHLQLHEFMEGPDAPRPEALRQLSRLLRLAEETGLYLDVTGLASYRKSAVPAWYREMTEAERWAAQAAFWSSIARTCRQSPAVLCYNLMNEPFVPGSKRAAGDWLAGELEGFSYVQAITLDPAGRPRAQIATEWVGRLVGAIRSQDTNHLITVGLLPDSVRDAPGQSGFVPALLVPKLDYISVHIYPKTGEFSKEMERLDALQTGRPLVVEEIFPLNCSPIDLRQFIHSCSNRVSGWISFYWGETPEELGRKKDIGSALTGEWIREFGKRSRD